MNRRRFVVGAGLLAGATVVGVGLPDREAPVVSLPDIGGTPPLAPPGRIDVQQQYWPPQYVQALQARGLGDLPQWSPAQALELLDQQGMQSAIVALPAPGVFFGNAQAAAGLARRCNEFAAELAVAHPGRFGQFASVPLPATEQACIEAIYALDHLHADGVTLLGSNAGLFLGDSRFEELMAELDRRHASVLVQANLHPSSTQLGLGTPPMLLETVCDLTRAAVNLVFTGTLERYPRINWILANGGGFLPYAAWRVSLANALPDFSEQVPQGVMSYLRRFYFSSAQASSSAPMAVLRELVEPSQVLYGSGWPVAPATQVQEEQGLLKSSTIWTADQQRGIEREHALRLFPRLRVAGERVIAAPVHGSESTGQWLGRMAKKPIGALAQGLKD